MVTGSTLHLRQDQRQKYVIYMNFFIIGFRDSNDVAVILPKLVNYSFSDFEAGETI